MVDTKGRGKDTGCRSRPCPAQGVPAPQNVGVRAAGLGEGPTAAPVVLGLPGSGKNEAQVYAPFIS